MKLITQILLLIFQSCICFAQDPNKCQITLGEKNNIKGKIETITFAEFKKKGKPIDWNEPKVNPKIDSIFVALVEQYPNSFGNKPQCIFLNSTNEQVEVCNDTTSLDQKDWVSYTIDDYKNGFLFFHERGYEFESYTLFNPKNRLLKSVGGYPNFIDSKAIFAVSADESIYFFEFQSLVNDNLYEFSCDDWWITKYYFVKNEFYFEFDPQDNKSFKYLKLTLPKF